MYLLYFKRILDFMIALLVFLLLSPIFISVAVILFFINDKKCFFFQRRPGKNGKIFKVIKFKSMNDRTDANGELLPFQVRITKFGHFIRNYSLDEIPQLLNVLKGDMSLIGPRPLLEEYLPLYNAFQQQRHEVKPGITGWAQVNGRNSITWEKKFELDVWYVKHLSFLIDSKIMILTLKKVLTREGINTNDAINLTKFTGSQ